MICPKCAKELPKGKFCPQCGSPLIEEKKPEEIWAVSQQMNNEAKAKKTEPV